MRKMVDDTKKTLLALNLVLNDEEWERTSPITIEPAAAVVLSRPANDDSSALAGEYRFNADDVDDLARDIARGDVSLWSKSVQPRTTARAAWSVARNRATPALLIWISCTQPSFVGKATRRPRK